MLVGRKYRLAFTPGQVEMAEEFGNICRAVWNTGLEQRREYRRGGAWVGYVQQAREVAEAKAERSWLKAAPSHILQQTLRCHGAHGESCSYVNDVPRLWACASGQSQESSEVRVHRLRSQGAR
ncbi:helix-turn-helix domain-containing protein [Streptomyces mirabilis]|uniref:helix-turn-helix domain-containing protein n=1 Tax=Streptomyces mirabilis TaxID=68239 RepID=UPI00339FC0F4